MKKAIIIAVGVVVLVVGIYFFATKNSSSINQATSSTAQGGAYVNGEQSTSSQSTSATSTNTSSTSKTTKTS